MSTLLAEIVATSTALSRTRSRAKKTAALARCLAALEGTEIVIGVAYLSGRPTQGKVGLGAATIRRLAPERAADEPSLTLAEVDACFTRMRGLSGSGSGKRRQQAWCDLLDRATADEQAFLCRLVLGELRQGALEALVLEALAAATEIDAGRLRRAVMLSGDLPRVARLALEPGGAEELEAFRVEIFRPLQPMLAQTAETPELALSRLGRAAFEYKMDGARIQVHRLGGDVRIFSRQLNDVTAALPEIVEATLALPVRSAILDGEVLACTPEGRPQPFQVTMRRFGRRRDVAAQRRALPLTAFYFDCLYLEGQELIDEGAAERHRALAQALPASLCMPRVVTADVAEAATLFERALAAGHEGLVAKALDAPYEAGSRGAGWLKLKPAQTLDLVVLAAEWGSGRRSGWLSNLHLGAREPGGVGGTDRFVMLGKTFKGMTDELLAWQTAQLLALEIGREGAGLVRVAPELVVEIAFSDVQRSPVYPAGLALRFARLRRYRPDKRPTQADTVDRVRALLPDS